MSKLTLDDVLLRLNAEVAQECGPNAVFARLEAERILEGKVRMKREPQFVRICHDLRLTVEEIDRLRLQVLWS